MRPPESLVRYSSPTIPLRAWFAVVLGCGLGCSLGGREDFLGFPAIDAGSPSEKADLAFEMVRATEQRILGARAEGGQAESAWKRAAWLRLMDVYVALSNDEIGAPTGLDPQGTSSRRPPLYLYSTIHPPCQPSPPRSSRPAGGREPGPRQAAGAVAGREALRRPSPLPGQLLRGPVALVGAEDDAITELADPDV